MNNEHEKKLNKSLEEIKTTIKRDEFSLMLEEFLVETFPEVKVEYKKTVKIIQK